MQPELQLKNYLSGAVQECVTQLSVVDFELEYTVNVRKFEVDAESTSSQCKWGSDEWVDAYEFHLDIIAAVWGPCTVLLKFLHDDAVMLET